MNAYAVALENMMVKRAKPVTPEATVKSPKLPAVSAAAVDKIPFVATAIVTVLAPAVLSINKSNAVPLVALRAAPNRVPVGKVMVVAAAEVDVIYPVATCAAVAVAVALIALADPGVWSTIKPFKDMTGPENVVRAMICVLTYKLGVSISMLSAGTV